MHRTANCINKQRCSVQTKMRGRPFRYVVCFLYLFTGANAYSYRPSHHSQNLLDRILGTHSLKPLVVFLNLGSTQRSSEIDHLFGTEGDDGLVDAENDSHEAERHQHESTSSSSSLEHDEVYFLHHLLKPSTDSTSSSSSSLEDSIESNVKHALRTALRARCTKVDKCAKQCPPKKPSCPMNCQEKFDSMYLCPPPPPPDPCDSKKPRCGRTMPPRWKF